MISIPLFRPLVCFLVYKIPLKKGVSSEKIDFALKIQLLRPLGCFLVHKILSEKGSALKERLFSLDTTFVTSFLRSSTQDSLLERIYSKTKDFSLKLQALRKHDYSKISPPKTENFQIKNSDIFQISARNIDCGYSLEPPRRGGSNEYPQSMCLSRNKKK